MDLEVGSDEVRIAVVPSEDIITWLHDRATFTSNAIHLQVPDAQGSFCESADVWIYWFHDFRKQQLAVQRVGGYTGEDEIQVRAIARLLLDALEEASKWKLPRVVIWSPGDGLIRAIKLLEQDYGVDAVTEERIGRSIPSVRWRASDESRAIKLQLCEFYTWN
jgi:hypothetical protein